MKKLFKNKIFKGVVGTLLCVCILLFVAVIGINAYMISFSKKNFVFRFSPRFGASAEKKAF